MAGRTTNRYIRTYVDEFDLSGYARSIGPLSQVYGEADLTVLTDAAKGYFPDQATVSPGTYNGVFDNTATSGFHVVGSNYTQNRVVTVAIGDRAAPVQGNPVFCGEYLQLSYSAEDDGGAVVANMPFGPNEQANLINYSKPWGTLAHALSAADSDGNTAVLYQDGGSDATAFGGYMVYHVTSCNGDATIKMQHGAASADSDAADLAGCTTGVVDFSSGGSGVVTTTANTTSVNPFIRWQVVTGTATTITFVLSFVRASF